MTDIQKIIKEKNLIIGTERTIKNLKNGKLKEVFLTRDCKKETAQDIKHYAKLFNVTVTELDKSNKELGSLCKKQFSISVLSY